MLIDTSVLVKWFHEAGEQEVTAARALRDAHVAGKLRCRALDLGFYEFGNVLLGPLGRPAGDVRRGVTALGAVIGAAVAFDETWAGRAAELGEQHRLSFYDACWAAAAQHLAVPLVSADRQLLDAGLAESPTVAATRLGLMA